MENLECLKKSSGSNAALEEFMAYKKSVVLWTLTDVDLSLLFADHLTVFKRSLNLEKIAEESKQCLERRCGRICTNQIKGMDKSNQGHGQTNTAQQLFINSITSFFSQFL